MDKKVVKFQKEMKIQKDLLPTLLLIILDSCVLLFLISSSF